MKLETNDYQEIFWPNNEKLETEDIEKIVKEYMNSKRLELLNVYSEYYEGKNTTQMKRVHDRNMRRKTPNNFVPTPYYATLVDTLSGYMFQNVQYEPKTEDDKKIMLDIVFDCPECDCRTGFEIQVETE